MNRPSIAQRRRSVFLTILVLCSAAAAALFPSQYVSPADKKLRKKGLFERTVSKDPNLPNYDIRTDKKSNDKLVSLRQKAGISAARAADVRDSFVNGEKRLRSNVPSLKIEYNRALSVPEVISPDVKQGKAFLSGRTGGKRSDALKDFVREYTDLFGLTYEQINGLEVFSDYANPEGGLSFVELNQKINNIPVFGGELKAGFTKDGKIIRVINNLAPGLEYSAVSTDFGNETEIVRAALRHINRDPDSVGAIPETSRIAAARQSYKGTDVEAIADKIYFPTEPGMAVPAWRVLIWQPVNAFYLVVDAASGTLLWRKNITNDQTQSATYNVWANPNAMVNVADSPFPMSPGRSEPDGGQAGALARTSITRIGNEAPYTFNNNGWITDGVNFTVGNAVKAGLDRDAENGIDPAGSAEGSPTRVFDFPVNPGVPTNPAQNTGDSPLPADQTPNACLATGTAPALTDFQKASVTQLFYIANWFHDETYRLGFTEAARNFQLDNFGRGGIGGDSVRAEGQDCSGVNNANFGTPPDGFEPRMQMFLFTGPTPDFDGDLDAEVVLHEMTHGLSNRLHGNAAGLSTGNADGMGEGWSDFYAQAMLSEPSDAIDGVYAVGSYDTYLFGGVGFNNYYYGIRRFPTAIRSSTGGPNNRPHNPLTFADLDETKQDLSDGAFAPAFTGIGDEVHNAGEIWNAALWEVRAKFIQRRGWDPGNRRWLQFVTDGMKLAPPSPTFISERDAIISAALAGGTAADVEDIWAGFAIRGIGAGASIQSVGGDNSGQTRVTESFDLPNLVQTPELTVTGNVQPGEQVTFTIPLSNLTGKTATGVTLQIVGGASANFGTIDHGASSTQQVNFTIPLNTPCGSLLPVVMEVNSSLGPTTITRNLVTGIASDTLAENFDSVTAPAVPAGWTVDAPSAFPALKFVSTTNMPDSAPNSMFAPDLPIVPAADTDGGSTELTSPFIFIPTGTNAATVSFRHKFNTERDWDGGVLEISIGGSLEPFDDIISAGGTFLQNGYNGSMGVSSPNPLGGRNGWTGDSGGYITTIVRLPAAAAGQNIRLRWRFGADNNTAPVGGGWNVDNIKVQADFLCFISGTPKARADFDGDGRTDPSVFRPGSGTWFIDGSAAGFSAMKWGQNGDQIVPEDYDGDGKTDFAIYRAPVNSDPTFFILNSNGFVFTQGWWGLGSDRPMPGDYDGDGKADFAVFRPSENIWYILKSGGGMSFITWGMAGDIQVRGDYDGDGKTDPAIYRGGQWWILQSTAGQKVFNWGLAGDKPVPADYDGDGKDDMAVYRPSDGIWYIVRSSNGAFDFVRFGISTDIPVPGDYDGDGKADQAVYRDGTWYQNRSVGGFNVAFFGLPGDKPVPAGYLP